MALIKTSALVSAISGKVGGNIFSNNKGGAYVRSFSKPTNPNTSRQAAVRAAFGALSSNFRALPAAQKANWNSVASNYPYSNKLGETKILTGAQLYVKANNVLQTAGLPTVNSMPPAPKSLTQTRAEQSDANDFVYDSVGDTFTAVVRIKAQAALDDSEYIQVFSSNQVSAGITSQKSVRKTLIGSFGGASTTFAAGIISIDVSTELINAFGLGPSIYNKDSGLVMNFTIFSDTEGIAIPAGSQIYTMDVV